MLGSAREDESGANATALQCSMVAVEEEVIRIAIEQEECIRNCQCKSKHQ